MNLTPEQIAAAQKANLEPLSGLTNQALQSIEKFVELNMHFAKQSLSDSMNSAKKALEAKDIQQLLAHQAEAVLQPMAEKIMAYSRHLYELAHETQNNFTQSAKQEFQAG
ncbi:phasin family protein [Polynucleobacter necessarius]|uniref:phasin family protein n=1 Tax=Polynucleobacter necessarius TaxID=576610 RepID=UPI0018D5155E|nr:phasin family protein [Polynucleobacter necessarius]